MSNIESRLRYLERSRALSKPLSWLDLMQWGDKPISEEQEKQFVEQFGPLYREIEKEPGC